jgi:hypothetical protein
MSPGTVPKTSSSERTDMAFFHMISEASLCWRKVVELSSNSQSDWKNWPLKLQLVSDLSQWMQRQCLGVDERATPLEQLMKQASQEISANLRLMLRRPPYRYPGSAVPPWDNFDVMEAATNVLDRQLNTKNSPDLGPWAWKSWVPWHALAIVLAELCIRPQEASSERSYRLAKESFKHYASRIADSDSGMLWKPVSKLMRRADKAMAEHSITPGTVARAMDLTPMKFEDTIPQPRSTSTTEVFDSLPSGTDPGFPTDIGPLPLNLDWPAINGTSEVDNFETDIDTSWLNWDLFLVDVNSSTN